MEDNLINRAIGILREEGTKLFAKKVSAYVVKGLVKFFAIPYALFKTRGLNEENCSLNKLLDFAFHDLAGLIKPLQIHSEILTLLKIEDRMQPKMILEIGTADGGTLFLLCRVASKDATAISIDLPGGRFGGGYSRWRGFLYRAFVLPNQKIHLLRADSHKQETLELVNAILNGRKVDLLFIDGDHAYEGVSRDFEMYGHLVRQGGIIAFHDIVPGPATAVGGIPQFWKEIKGKYNSEEIVEDWNQGGYGIGLLYYR